MGREEDRERGLKVPLPDGTGYITKYLYSDKDRHGNVRLFYRRNGSKTRLRQEPGTAAFLKEYQFAHAAHEGEELAAEQNQEEPTPDLNTKADPESLRWLIEEYYTSSEFLALAESTREARRRELDNLCKSTIELEDEKGETVDVERGTLPYATMQRRHIKQIRDEKINTPHAANNLLKYIKGVFEWAEDSEYVEESPSRGIKRIRTSGGGHHPWDDEEVLQYMRRHPLGTKAGMALDILLYTGVRRSDGVLLGPDKEVEGGTKLKFTEQKGKGTDKQKDRLIPILPPLRRSIDANTIGIRSYLVTAYGKPFSADGFGNWFKERCKEAGLPHCSAHGLRKAGANFAVRNGATAFDLMAIFGWTSLEVAQRYIEEFNREVQADKAMSLVIPDVIKNEK